MDQEMIGINYEAGSFPLAWEQAKKRDQGPDKIRQSAFSSVVVAVLCRPGGAGATPDAFPGSAKNLVCHVIALHPPLSRRGRG